MDENYLDNLLNEVSLDNEIDAQIEEELDNLMMEERQKKLDENTISRDDAFNMDLEQDANLITEDYDFDFSEEQMEELDQLDNLADLDIGDSDFSDIDFDDLDVTKLDNANEDMFDDVLKDFEGDLEIKDSFDDIQEEPVQEFVQEPMQEFVQESMQEPYSDMVPSENEDLNVDSFDADSFLDSLLEESEMEENLSDGAENFSDGTENLFDGGVEELSGGMENLSGETENLSNEIDSLFGGAQDQAASTDEQDDLDDLFSLLNMEESLDTTGSIGMEDTTGEESYMELEENHDDMQAPEKPLSKKDKFMRLLFGEPDEDDIISEEEIAAAEAKKEAKKAKKMAEKAAKKEKSDAAREEKALKSSIKKKEADEKKKVKAEKKAKKKAEEIQDLEPEKKLNTPAVVFIFTVFLGGTFLFYLASNNFDYTQAIEKAANYFANQKYRNAYDEIIGVEVKEADQELEDRIYTVMYVERLYEGYENNIKLGREEKALDSLLRGVGKYYENYDEAVKLGIVSDLDYSFAQIQNVLLQNYGITVEQAVEINALGNYEYAQKVGSYITQAE